MRNGDLEWVRPSGSPTSRSTTGMTYEELGLSYLHYIDKYETLKEDVESISDEKSTAQALLLTIYQQIRREMRNGQGS